MNTLSDFECTRERDKNRGVKNKKESRAYLQHPFRQASFLRKLLQILRVRIVIDREVTLHRPQLVVFETRSHPFCSAVGTRYAGSSRPPPTERHIYVVRVQI